MNLPTTFIDFCELLNVGSFGMAQNDAQPDDSEASRLFNTFFSFLTVSDLITMRQLCKSTSQVVREDFVV